MLTIACSCNIPKIKIKNKKKQLNIYIKCLVTLLKKSRLGHLPSLNWPTNMQYKNPLYTTEDDYKGQVKITHFCETTDYARQ